jgi:hypothetical protein
MPPETASLEEVSHLALEVGRILAQETDGHWIGGNSRSPQYLAKPSPFARTFPKTEHDRAGREAAKKGVQFVRADAQPEPEQSV